MIGVEVQYTLKGSGCDLVTQRTLFYCSETTAGTDPRFQLDSRTDPRSGSRISLPPPPGAFIVRSLKTPQIQLFIFLHMSCHPIYLIHTPTYVVIHLRFQFSHPMCFFCSRYSLLLYCRFPPI